MSARHGHTQTEVEDLAREQRKADADVEQVKSRRTRDRERVEGGLVSDPKQLQAIQHEIETLDRRISALEDEELAVMERLEEAQGNLDRLAAELAAVESEGGDALKARDAATSDISSREDDARAERGLIAADIPGDLLASVRAAARTTRRRRRRRASARSMWWLPACRRLR